MAQEIITVGETRVPHVYGVPKDARIIFERDQRAFMRDGKTLAVNVFRPEKPGRYPTIFSLAPYAKDELPADPNYDGRIPNTGILRVSEWACFEAPDPVYWVPHGYVVIAADCRAINNSDGDHFEHFSKQMGEDYHDLVEWIAEQPWSDGKVASNGVSYLATTQWLGAAERPPHLTAIIPWEGFNDPYREHAFHGGIPDTRFFQMLWKRNVTRLRPGATTEHLWEEQATHPLNDDYWKAKHPRLADIDVPAYVVTGWATTGLHLRGTIEGYKQISSKDKWLEVHGRKEWETYYTREYLERQRQFLDHFLKGEENGWRNRPKVRIEVRERFYDGAMHGFDDFPLPGTDYQKLYLDAAANRLRWVPVKDESSITYDSRKDGTPDKAEFTVKFGHRTTLAGYMKLRLHVSAAAADDLDLHIGLKKYDVNGKEVHFPDFNHLEEGMVGIGWLRVSHRELDPARSTEYQPVLKHERLQKVKPGEIVPVDIEIMPSATAFDKGETLKLVVQGHDVIDFWFRHFHDDTVNQGTHTIHTGGQYESYLLVPQIPALSPD